MSTEQQYENEISLIDIFKVLKQYRRSILLTPLVVMLVAVFFAWLFVQPTYKAYGTIQAGQVDGRIIESGFVLQQRLKDMSFLAQVIKTHPDAFKYERDLAKDLEVKKDKDTDLVTFSLAAHQFEVAQQKALAFIDTLKQQHGEIFKQNVEMLQNQIDQLNKQISDMQQEEGLFRKSLTQSRELNSTGALMAMLAKNQSQQLHELVDKRDGLSTALSSALTFNTKLLGEIYVTPNSVSPNFILIAAISFLVGLFGAIFAAFVRNNLTSADF